MEPQIFLFVAGYVAKTFSSLFAIIALYFLTQKGQPDTARLYRRSLVWTISIDLLYSTCGLLFYPIVNFEADTVIFEFMAFHFLHLGHRTAAFTEGALLILVVIVLPIQAIVRYGNLRSKPLSSSQLDGMFIFCIFIAILYGLLTSAAVSPWESPNPPPDAYPRVIVVVQLNATISRAMTFVCVLLVITTYALIVIYTLRARMLMKTMQRVISNETKRLQARMRKLIIIQTVFPLFCLVTPTFLLGAYPYLDLKNYTHLLNDFCTTCFIWISLFNPLSVIMLMPQYRRKFFRALCWGTSPKSPAATMVTSIAEAQTVRRQ